MIEILDYTKRFDSVVALNQISFQIQEGCIFGLVGSNGAGKSTLLRSLCGVYAADGGEIRIDGQSPYENPRVKDQVVFVPDFPYYLPQANLRTMADLYRRVYSGWSKDEFQRLCSLFGLDQKMKLHNMSKGMQRQAALICALAARPKYLLLDEVFDGLDPVMRQLLKRIVSDQVAERNMTVVIASHNLRELEDFCDHVGLIHQGGVVFEQELDTLKLGIHKAQAVFQPPLEQQQIQWLREQLNIVKLDTSGSMISLVARKDEETVEQVLSELHPVFSETLPLSLEEVFISEMEAVGYDLDKILS
ncbi:MAG: ABC transporter ATP-binding protein [Clostridiales bacterium]|nr:ABC transporter ATP-binding protein [Clostridiales bacterium]